MLAGYEHVCLFCACLFISVGYVCSVLCVSVCVCLCLLCTAHRVNLSLRSSAFACVCLCVRMRLYSKLIWVCVPVHARVCVCVCCWDGWEERDLLSQAALTHMASEACAPFNCTASSQVTMGGAGARQQGDAQPFKGRWDSQTQHTQRNAAMIQSLLINVWIHKLHSSDYMSTESDSLCSSSAEEFTLKHEIKQAQTGASPPEESLGFLHNTPATDSGG